MHNNRSKTVRYNKTLITAPKKEKRQTCKIKTEDIRIFLKVSQTN